MKPVKFAQQNAVYATNQPEYLPLPAYRDHEITVSCWGLTWLERLKILFTGRLWLLQKNFGKPLQPQLPDVDCPFGPAEKLIGDPADDYDYNMTA